MRPDASPELLALLESGEYDDHWQVLVANGSGTLVDVTHRVYSISYTEPSPDAPIASASVTLRRGVGVASLSPLMQSSTYNRLDDGTTYSPLLQVGREIVLRTSIVPRAAGAAYRASAPGDFFEVFRGRMAGPRFPERYGDVEINALDQGGTLSTTWTEAIRTYAAGTPIEEAAQAVLDDNGWDSITLNVPIATGQVLSADLRPDYQPVWTALTALAQSIGWVLWRQYDADGVAQLTLFEPHRAKSTTDFEFGPDLYSEVTDLDIDEEAIRNVVQAEAQDEDRKPIKVQVEDAVSIIQYGGGVAPGIRRFMRIGLGEDSPVRTLTGLTNLATQALSDLKDPDASQEIETAFFPIAQCAVDRYLFAANGVHYNTDQEWAPFSVRHEMAVDRITRTYLRTRGQPSGGTSMWTGHGSAPPRGEPDYSISRLEIVGESATQRTYLIHAGPAVTEVWVYVATFTSPVPEDAEQQVRTDGNLLASGLADGGEFSVDLPAADEVVIGVAIPYHELDGGELLIRGAPSWFVIEGTPAPFQPRPSITEDAAGTTGTARVTIVSDPRGIASAVAFYVSQPNQAETGPHDATTGTDGEGNAYHEWSFPLPPKPHVAYVRAVVTRADGLPNIDVTFPAVDADKAATVESATPAYDDGVASITVKHDSDTVTGAIKGRYRVDGGSTLLYTIDSSGIGRFDVSQSTATTKLVEMRGENANGDLGEWYPITINRNEVAPALRSFLLGVDDDGGDDTYTATWEVTAAVTSIDHNMELRLYRNSLLVDTVPIADPTVGSDVYIDVGGGDGVSDTHYAEAYLLTADGSVIDYKRTRPLPSAI